MQHRLLGYVRKLAKYEPVSSLESQLAVCHRGFCFRLLRRLPSIMNFDPEVLGEINLSFPTLLLVRVFFIIKAKWKPEHVGAGMQVQSSVYTSKIYR